MSSERVEELVAALTLDEKVTLLAGRDLWSTVPVERLGIPSIRVTDGPNGVRGKDDNHGPTTTSYPVGAAMGATWDPDLVEELGEVLGTEASAAGASVQLGPTMNIPRVPVAGRNFECFSEAPVLSGELAAAYVRGLQSTGTAACIKHVVCNDQETDRFTIDVDVDERALREVYLEPFRIAVAEAGPWSAMSAYNSLGGVQAAAHPLLDDVLRDEYGFDGLVVSDWYGTYSTAVHEGGLDLEMPGPGRWHAPERLRRALDEGRMTPADLDRKVANVLTLVERTVGLGGDHPVGATDATGVEDDEVVRERAADVARRVATASVVLLHNDGVLPLRRARRVAVIGEHAVETPHQGGGSSSVRAHHVVSVLDGLSDAVGDATEVVWAPGTPTWRRPPLPPASTLAHDGGEGWVVTYADGDDPHGEVVRTAVTTRPDLGFFGPGDDWVDHDRFALRMSGTYTPRVDGSHRFSALVIGRVRIHVDGALVLDAWEPGTHDEGWSRELTGGVPVEVVVEYASTPGETWRMVRLGVEEPVDGDSIADAAALAATADVAVVVVGLGAEWESEGVDRPDLRLPRRQDELVAAVAAASPATVVVVASGAPVELPWLDDVGAVVHAWYGGQEVGHAVAAVLTGAVDPGGRLPVVWPTDSRQHPGLLNFPGDGHHVRYGEGVLVGQRAYDRLGIQPLFPLGHGLSYTSFDAVVGEVHGDADGLVVPVELRNTGDRDGTDVVQVVARSLGDAGRLVGFARRDVAARGSADVLVRVGADRLRRWDVASRSWVAPTGRLALEVRGAGWTREVVVDLGEEASGAAGIGEPLAAGTVPVAEFTEG